MTVLRQPSKASCAVASPPKWQKAGKSILRVCVNVPYFFGPPIAAPSIHDLSFRVGLSELLKEEDFLFHYKNLLLARWRRKTYLCYELKGKKPVVLRNKPKSGDKLEGTHVEVRMETRPARMNKEHAQKQKTKQKPSHSLVQKLFVKALDPKFNGQVTCYLSWSPCAKCSKTLVQFVKQNTKVKLRILASRLYLYEEEDIREGLRSLHAAGVSIDIMAEKGRLGGKGKKQKETLETFNTTELTSKQTN